MTYTKPRHCIFCGDPESLCQCGPEILEFARAHVVPTDDGRGIVEGDTLRVLIERAQAWGREKSSQYVNREWLPPSDGLEMVPAVPTAAMLRAGNEQLPATLVEDTTDYTTAIWNAMLRASRISGGER